MTTWRYIAQRAVTGEWLDWDLPIQRDELSWALSGAGSLRGTITPDVGQLRAADGRLIIEEWGTLLYAEADGEIRWGGIVTRSAFVGASWEIEAAGFSAYPHGIPYLGSYSALSVDPLDALREVWAHVQSNPDGDLGIVVDSTTCPVRLGVPAQAAYQEVFLDGFWLRRDLVPPGDIVPSQSAKLKYSMTATQTTLTLATMGGYDALTPPYSVTVGSETITVGARSGLVLQSLTRGVGTSTPSGHSAGTAVKHTGTPVRDIDAQPAEPYALAWWDAPDCGSEVDTLSRETPFDYVEEHSWDGEEVAHRLRIGYPRFGRRRTDLAFIQGDNVIGVVEPERDGAGFANEVIALGAGEGKRSLQRRIPERDGRLRRPIVYSDKAITTGARLDAIARATLATHRTPLEIPAVEVVNHPHAPIGSWQLGDDILVQAVIPWLGDIAIWHRITGWALLGDDRASLSLRRSDAFTYGS